MSNREGTGEWISRRPRTRPCRPGRWGWRRPSRAREVLGRALGPLRPRCLLVLSCGDRCPWAPVRPGLVLVATVVRVKRAPVRPGLVLVLWRRPLPAALFAGAGAASLVVAGTLLVVGDTTIRGEASVDVLVCTSLGTLYAALTRVAARSAGPSARPSAPPCAHQPSSMFRRPSRERAQS